MDGFSEEESVVVVAVLALRLEAVPSNRTIRILAACMRISGLMVDEVWTILLPGAYSFSRAPLGKAVHGT
jgi:hypothetical protein